MKTLLLLVVVISVSSTAVFAHEGMLGPFKNDSLSSNYAYLSIGQTYSLKLYYVTGDGPALGKACEFKLLLSSDDAVFLEPVWSDQANCILGDIASGISIASDMCFGLDRFGNCYESAYIGTIPVLNVADEDTFVVTVVGHPGVTPPCIRITICNPDHPMHEIQGGEFTFQATLGVIGAVAVTPTQVHVTYSKEVAAVTAENESNYEIFETANPSNSFDANGATLLGDQVTVVLSLGNTLSNSNAYTLKVTNIEDTEGNPILDECSEMEILRHDWTAPWLSSVNVVWNNLVEFIFNEPMDLASAEDCAHYEVFETMNPTQSLPVVSATVSDNESEVLLRLGGLFSAGIGYTVIVTGVQDIAGNVLDPDGLAEIHIPLEIVHIPDDCENVSGDVYVPWDVSDALYGVTSTCLNYGQPDSPDWTERCEGHSTNPHVMVIPRSAMTVDGAEYFITAVNGIGIVVYHGTPGNPHIVPYVEPDTCAQPYLLLAGYQSMNYEHPFWSVTVFVRNLGPGTAVNVNASMNSDVSWLVIPDPYCSYGDIPAEMTGTGVSDGYTFDLSEYPGGNFNVWFDVTYEDSCGNQYRVRLDPEFDPEDRNEESIQTVTSYQLNQNYPNPFNPSTTIRFQLPASGHASLSVYDASGKLIRTIVNGFMKKGSYRVDWDGRDSVGRTANSGVYFYQLKAGSFIKNKKMVLLR
ncbi:MAG: Ig-like domain-containing protein [bacterium]|nr:MAG: Ig-like domain-containing protein [bacterium]